MKILVVDDDKEIVELLSIYLKNEGYEPIAAYSGKEAITKLTTIPDIALMILDVMMPNMTGIEVIKEVRKDSDIPIIIVSAKTGDMDKIQGLITGADDYVSKPFNPLEVMARVRSLLRRSQKQVKDDEPDVLEVGPLVINRDSHEVKTIGGKDIQLTALEFGILYLLASHPNRVFQLMKSLKEYGNKNPLFPLKLLWSTFPTFVIKSKKQLVAKMLFRLCGELAIK